MNLRKGFFSSAATGVLAVALVGGGVVFAHAETPAVEGVETEWVEEDWPLDPEPVSLPTEEAEGAEEATDEEAWGEIGGEWDGPIPTMEPAPADEVWEGSLCPEGLEEVWLGDDVIECVDPVEEVYCDNGLSVEEQMAWLESEGYVLRANEDPCGVEDVVEDVTEEPAPEPEPSDEPTSADSAP